jgi:hypothetical protein
MRTAPKAGHMTAADQIVTASKKSLDPRAPSTHEHLGRHRGLSRSEEKLFTQKVTVRTRLGNGSVNVTDVRWAGPGIVPMNDEDKRTKRCRRNLPVRESAARIRATATTVDTCTATRVSVPVVPKLPVVPALIPRASVWRLGGLTTTLILVLGAVAFFHETPVPFSAESIQPPEALSSAAFLPTDPLSPQVRESLNQELRLALDLRESQEIVASLSDDRRALAASVGALVRGLDHLKADVGAARIAARTRIEERLQEVKAFVIAEPVLLGDPALRELSLSGYAEMETNSATTGGLPNMSPAPQATVTVGFNNPKPALTRAPIKDWHIHHANADSALVGSKDVYYRVQAGHVLPGPGIVRAIKKRGDHWVVLTSKGVISEGR